jgi:hypothetical protein
MTCGTTAPILLDRILEMHNVQRFFSLTYVPWNTSREEEAPKRTPDEQAARALRHDTAWELDNRTVHAGDEDLTGIIAPAASDEAVGIYSDVQVELDTGAVATRHLPMLDFSVPVSKEGEAFVEAAVWEMGETFGAILNSGRSYHYVGFDLMTPAEWMEFMHQAILLAPHVDAPYLGHRLLTGAATLRITSGKYKPETPRIVSLL